MSLQDIQKCYATPSAGMHPSHTLPMKLRAIAKAGFFLAEISFPEVLGYAQQRAEGMGLSFKGIDENGKGDVDKVVDAANEIKSLCDRLGVKILVMHPFSGIEGEQNPKRRAAAFERAKVWFKVMKGLRCQAMQLGSNKNQDITSSFHVMANDIREPADLAAQENPPILIAYEMWAWGTYVNTWRHTWEICKLVDRKNFLLCLDTFQICAQDFADPTRADGLSVEVAISDCARVEPGVLIRQTKDNEIHPLFMWSEKYRPLPYSKRDGYLPVNDIVEAVLKTGWRGPWSYEVFFEQDMARDDSTIPERWTTEAADCHEKVLQEMKTRIAT